MMGFMTHLDQMKNNKSLNKTKKRLKHRYVRIYGPLLSRPACMMMPQPCLLLARRCCCSPAFLAPPLLLVRFRFWTEIYQGAKMFYMSGVINGKYLKSEVRNTALYISRMKFRPLTWRNTHPYVVVDRFEDITPPDLLQQDPNVRACASLPMVPAGLGLTVPLVHGPVGAWCVVCVYRLRRTASWCCTGTCEART